jgi:hypothetical protein
VIVGNGRKWLFCRSELRVGLPPNDLWAAVVFNDGVLRKHTIAPVMLTVADP